MRITLVSGDLEPGRDGVGDYARCLAAEASALGASCRLLALADRHVAASVREQHAGVDVLRLPATTAWRTRVEAARQFLRSEPPDWVSLQFVPYSFDARGLTQSLVRAMPALIDRARLHVMLHEIWIDGSTSWRRRLVALGQRRSILALCRRPGTVIHTSNGTYRRLLSEHRVRAETLPLFGSIPIAVSAASSWLTRQLSDAGCDALSGNRCGWWLVVLFGTLHPIWPSEPLLGNLQAAAAAAGKRIACISVGRLGAGEGLWNTITAAYSPKVTMLCLGEQPASRISELLQAADFGVATTPRALIGKSATVAAMLEHGLPIIVNREDCAWPDTHVPAERERALLIRMDDGLAASLERARRLPPERRLPAITRQWLGALERVDVAAAGS